MKHAADSLLVKSPERSPVFERAVPLRGVKRKEERFGFLASTSDSVVVSFRGVKIRTAVLQKSASASAARPNQSAQTTRLLLSTADVAPTPRV
jgi:hypothetical protein